MFDLDGTLVDTSEDIAFSLNHMRERLGQPRLETKEVLAAVGRGAPYLLSTLLGVDGGDERAWRPLLEAYEAHYLAHQGERSSLYPGIAEAVARLASRHDLYVLSNKPQTATRREVEKAGISQCFKDIWGAGALPALKPDPAGVLRAIEQSGVDPRRAVMVGDLSVDIETGLNAGVKTCFVTWGFGKLPGDIRPTAAASSAAALEAAIERMIS